MEKTIQEKLLELRTAVNQSAQLTKHQVDCIKFNNPLTIPISVAISLGLVYWLDISVYWIPASLITLCLWSVFKGLEIKSFDPKKVEKSSEKNSVLKKQQIIYRVDFFIIKKLLNSAKGVALICGISLLILLALNRGWIDSTANLATTSIREISMFGPVLIMVMYLLLPFLLHVIIIRKRISPLSKFLEKVDRSFLRKPLLCILIFLHSAFIGWVALGPVRNTVLPFIQILGFARDWEFFVIVLIFSVVQYVFIMVVSSYYSSQNTLKHLTNTLKNYSDINDEISQLLLCDKANEKIYAELTIRYRKAKPYDLLIEDLTPFIQFYDIEENPTYFNAIGEHKLLLSNEIKNFSE